MDEQKAIDCMTQHIKIFLKQASNEEIADFGKPCSKCMYVNQCNFNWPEVMLPIISKSNVKISACKKE